MRRFTAAIVSEVGWYVAHCIELGVMSQGKTIEEAQANLKEAVELYLESDGELGGAGHDGEVKLGGEGDQAFAVRPELVTRSPLDVESLDLGVTTSEIVELVREDRE